MHPSKRLAVLCTLAAVLAAPASAQCVDDALEPNDSCTTATPLTPGSWTDLVISGWQSTNGWKEDYYELTVPAGHELDAQISWDVAEGGLQLWLFDGPPCTSNTVDGDFQGYGSAQVSYNNITGAPVDLILKVKLSTSSTVCISYDMGFGTAVNPCGTAVDDGFEDNDDCSTAVPIGLGTHTDLSLFGDGHQNGLDEDWYVVQGVPAGDILTVELAYTHADGDIALGLYDAQCGASTIAYSNYQFGVETVRTKNDTGAPADYRIRAEAFDFDYDCGEYDLTIASAPDPCDTTPDDIYAPNPSCGSAAALGVGTHTGLQAYHWGSDWFEFSVPPNKRLTVDALFLHDDGNIDIELFDGCGASLDSSTSFTDDEFLSATNATASTVTYRLEVSMPYPLPNCNGYDLVVDLSDDPCLTGGDDVYAPNHFCGVDVELTPGSHPNLFVSKYFPDYFRVGVAPSETLEVEILCNASAGNVVAFLYELPMANCDGSSHVASQQSTSDAKTLVFTNTDAVEREYVLELVIRDWDDDDCNVYDLNVTGAGGDAGVPFCLGDGTTDVGGGPVPCPCGNDSALGAGEGCENSAGSGARLSTQGSAFVVSDDLSFVVSGAIPNQPSMLVQGASQVAIPFKDGLLCAGSPTERVEVVFLDGNGEGATSGSIVTNGNVAPGDTRVYQQWYRDPGGVSPCGTGSNFSGGLLVTWL